MKKPTRRFGQWCVRWTIFSLACLMFYAGSVCGQDYRATLSGQVTDPSEAAISGATVRAINVDTKEAKEAKTTAEGSYTIPYLNPGVYDVEVSAADLPAVQRSKINLLLASSL